MLLSPQQGLRYRVKKKNHVGWGEEEYRLIPLEGACSSQEKLLLWYQGMTLHRDPESCSPTSLPTASHSRLFSGNFSLHCLPFVGAPRDWLQKKNLVLWLLKRTCVCLRWALSLPGGQKPCCLSPMDATWIADSGSGNHAGEPSLGFRLHSSQREAPTAMLSSTTLACYPWE